MELFGRQGFKATSIVQIEQAAGLAEGSGGIYYHFRTKQALLEAGIDRHLGRLRALRDIQAILVDLGDLRAELTVLGRYALAELDSETHLLRVILAEARTRPELVETAVEQLVDATYSGFATWLHTRGQLSQQRANEIAAVGLGALISARLIRLLLGRDPITVPDEAFIATWVHMLYDQISPPGRTPP
jgi:AcrR family transcriptional regulator